MLHVPVALHTHAKHVSVFLGSLASPSSFTHFSSLLSSFQGLLDESFAVVYAPKSDPNFGIFPPTDPPGLQTVLKCTAKQASHLHLPPASRHPDIWPRLHNRALAPLRNVQKPPNVEEGKGTAQESEDHDDERRLAPEGGDPERMDARWEAAGDQAL
ncbi:hypothetical protein FB451DRAFT_1416808 [Mycena latifolia]|nr:hypothetical protein FB451DRAFT_1416808 [Mycena latifolia]